MNKKEHFKALLQELVTRCEGNQAEAARQMDVAASFVHNTLNGKGPSDPRSESWQKLARALQITAPATRYPESLDPEKNTVAESLADWYNTAPAQAREAVTKFASLYGYQPPKQDTSS